MIRLITRMVDIGAAANVGGPVDSRFKTFDVLIPELEQYLKKNNCQYVSCEVIGVEVVDPDTPKKD